ncbi:G protein-coupled glucose receptor regulating Gpa2-domain-containing protein [Lasiosphaeria ovina]|uniref:G protein-coupled glucose receptor regulating Gpa2-domain-containing protein n=1 Tax=Lasiosphaeria ovina TaxID=92902 RepID=A0AAE0NDA0_9PEZI|nr:G protein-coupled glucose receptor regulating Gpa2-domain-containing protein [Lasiosphaeria ovina]
MADNHGYSLLDKNSDSLFPLPAGHRQGLTAVTVLASISFASSNFVLLYLTLKLLRWHIERRTTARRATATAPTPVDLSLGLAERHFVGQDASRRGLPDREKAHPNQFLVLVFNLFLADVHQSAAFLLNGVWIGQRNGIDVHTRTCFAQGWLVSTGDLASSCFITAIAFHTYLGVVRNYKPPQWALNLTVVGLWVFDYLLAILGPVMTNNGREYGGFYVRAAAWCWMNVKYDTYRLVLHYLFIFISLAMTSIVYTLIFLHLRNRSQSLRAHANTSLTDSETGTTNGAGSGSMDPKTALRAHSSTAAIEVHSGGHHNAFLLYPVIYVVCTAPLAVGRIVSMAGVNVPVSYFCVAGALISSNGWLDVLLWGVTRRRLLFGSDIDAEDTGLGTFTFMRTPPDRKYGNMVWVEGAAGQKQDTEPAREEEGRVFNRSRAAADRGSSGWKRLGLDGRFTGRRLARRQASTASEESLRGKMVGAPNDMIIQMDMVTSVVVEPNVGRRKQRHGESLKNNVGSYQESNGSDMNIPSMFMTDSEKEETRQPV